MCDNSRTWMYNLMLVAATLLVVTAPLIQHVACVANGIPADITIDTVESLPHTTLAKREVANTVVVSGSTETDDGLRDSRNGDVDFQAYINEFNMQKEASIPEDILDQQHIQDENEDVQYATESEATDIIFESEGLIPRNFTSHDATKSNHNDFSGNNIYQKKDMKTNKRKIYDENDNREKYDSKKEEFYDDIAIVGDELATDDEDTIKQSMDMSSGSDAYKKFKGIKGEQNGQDQHRKQHQFQQQQQQQEEEEEQEQQKQEQQDQEQQQHQEQLQAIVKLNERKFNKGLAKETGPAQDTTKNRKTSKYANKKNDNVEDKDHKDYKLGENENENEEVKIENEKQKKEKQNEDEDDVAAATIGDIEDNFRNEDETLDAAIGDGNAAAAQDEDVDVHVDENDDDDDDEGGGNDSGYGDGDDFADKDKSVAASNAQRSISVSKAESQMLASTIVGRKAKRFNRVRTFNSGDREQPPPMQLDDMQQKSHPKLLTDDKDKKTDQNNNRQYERPEIVAEAKFLNDYAIKSYGIDATTRNGNGSNGFRNTENTSGQLQQYNGYAVLAEENANNGETRAEQATFERENVQRKQHQMQPTQEQDQEQHQQQQPEPQPQPEQEQEQELEQTQHESSMSAFERHKARRRNNRHYGHKTHKKRYKDYLRFAMTPAKTIPTTLGPLATRNASQKGSASGLEIETFTDRDTDTDGDTDTDTDTDADTVTVADRVRDTELDVKRQSGGLVNGTNATIAATLAKLTNNSERNYENKHEMKKTENFDENEQSEKRAEKLRKHARKFEAEKSHDFPASPIFVVSNRNSVTAPAAAATATRFSPTKPFYEGQINYFTETKDDEQTGREDDGNLQTDTVNWYRRVSPILRNGVKTSYIEGNEPPSEHRRKHNHHQHHHYQHHSQHQRQYPHHHHHQQHNHHHQMQHEYKHQQQQTQQLQQQRHHHHKHHHHHLQHSHPPQEQQQQQKLEQLHHSHRKHQQTNKHYQSAQSNPYQRKLVKKPSFGNSREGSPLYSTPIPPPSYKPHSGAMQELGHQITEMEELERYYAKWPHLARVQLQVYDEHFRELHPDLYPDYDQDYESAAELEEAQNGNSEDANLPPYIKKYNRRNKQLLNLLEGTLAPPTTRPASFRQGHFSSLLQPGPHESSSGSSATVVRIDDDYMKEKRRRYHNRYGNSNNNKNNNQHNGFQYDLFAEQRATVNANDSLTTQRNSTELDVVTQKPTTTTTTTTRTRTTTAMATGRAIASDSLQNKIPEEDISITREEQDDTDWQEEIETKSNGNGVEMTGNVQMSWQIEKLTTPSTPTSSPSASASASASPKLALFRMPSYPAISGSYIGKPRSRSAQFAPSSSSRGNSFINMHRDYHNFEKTRHMSTAMSTVAPGSQVSESTDITQRQKSPPKTINSFIYHRVVDSAPRFVGAGATGLKQRLPFVAITDRRLETAKKTLMEHKQDLEQNFYPMP